MWTNFTVLSTFQRLGGSVRLKLTKVRIDTAVFRLHYRATTLALFAFSLICSTTTYFGAAISCLQNDAGVEKRILDNYCFISQTFTIPKVIEEVGHELAHLQYRPVRDNDPDDLKYHAYYQWVPFVLFGQGLLFYVPFAAWKVWEGTKVRSIIQGLNVYDLRNAAGRDSKEQILANYLVANLNCHTIWGLSFYLCQMFNMAHVVAEIWIVNWFLGGEFLKYGVGVVKFLAMDPEVRVDPMEIVFPKISKCTFNKYGPSGTINTHDAMCILPLNIINEKIYVFLWFWFVILAAITGVDLVYRLTVAVSASLRKWILGRRTMAAGRQYDAQKLSDRCHLADFVLLDLLSRNMDPVTFTNVVAKVALQLHDSPAEHETLIK